MIKIVIDCYGGDKSPNVNVEGAIKALNEVSDIYLIFVGKEDEINKILSSLTYDKARVEVVNANDVISLNEAPVQAIRSKNDSSMVKAFDILHKDDTVGAMVSTGSTGALLAGSIFKIGRIPGVKRPAFCPIMPTMNKGIVAICDSGANIDCDSLNLHQFAIMGSLYLQKAFNVENPRIALLNVGVEEEKGDALRKETYPILKKDKTLNFQGNMESRELLTGKFDLIVTDGFNGNVLIKSTEGACLEMLKLLKTTFTKSTKNKMGALFLKKDIYELKDFMDYRNYGGAPMLGIKKTVIKGHGSSTARTVYNCVLQAYNMEKGKLVDEIGKAINASLAE
ncbi:MAG: phosphate acyltransferase PlsX [Bacilli bacterium]|nr:phosphate acyltransferase PlsX [Bacilli bacterium]